MMNRLARHMLYRTRQRPHTAPTGLLAGIYPYQVPPTLPVGGPYMGRDLLSGNPAHLSPFVLYARGYITSPNVLVAGMVGMGKSAWTKTLVLRSLICNPKAKTWVIDPKGEYASLAQKVEDGVVIKFGPDTDTQINPLYGLSVTEQIDVCWTIITAVTHQVNPNHTPGLEAKLAVTHALKMLRDNQTTATLALLTTTLRASNNPDGTPAADALETLQYSTLRGITGTGTTATHTLTQKQIVVIDLSRVPDDDLPIVTVCVQAWINSIIQNNAGQHRYLVLDECWRMFSGNIAIARWLQKSWKLCRQHGTACIAIIHRLTDLNAAGDEHSQARTIAEGILSDSGIRIFYRQPPDTLAYTAEKLHLTDTQTTHLEHLPRGQALWLIGNTPPTIVQHQISPPEEPLIDTDHAMRGGDTLLPL